ncbi:MAG: AMP-binding protein [Deltaproteobacteria bacterium]|nr:AMP-binding protein [Deltaproteobacteria bacterium]MBW2650739.1 AMP-binding protein [Deltaproteobacteria bacterium]
MHSFFDDSEIRSTLRREEDNNLRLSAMVDSGYRHSKRVSETLDKLGLKPSDVASVGDLEKLPVISREEVVELERSEPPFGGFCAPDVNTDRIFISPGPVYEPHLGENELWARGYFAAGFRKGDRVLNTFSYHMVAAGLTFHEGLRSAGATVIPSGTSGTETQVQLIRDLGATGYTGTPSFLIAIINKAEDMGYDFNKDFGLRRACFVAEPLQPSLRKRFEEEYGIDTYQMYGATEVGDIAYECSEKAGWHICEDVIVEIVDPSTGKCVEPGRLGEVVVTRLNDIFFLLRFGTGDLSSIVEEDCACGRTSRRLSGIAGRVGDAVKVRGMFITPGQLARMGEAFPRVIFQVVVTRESYRDLLTVAVVEDEGYKAIDIGRFRDVFSEICAVKIDRIEPVKEGMGLREEGKLIIDKREWK